MEERLQVGKATRSTPRIHPSLRALLYIENKSTRNIKNKTLICFKKINILFLIACYRSPLKNLGSIFHSMWLK